MADQLRQRSGRRLHREHQHRSDPSGRLRRSDGGASRRGTVQELHGSQFIDIAYTGFSVGEQHIFLLDVDPFQCSSDCDDVPGSVLSGASIQFVLGGASYTGPSTLEATFLSGEVYGLDPYKAYAVTHAPEPATWGLLGTGLIALGLFGRRRKRG